MKKSILVFAVLSALCLQVKAQAKPDTAKKKLPIKVPYVPAPDKVYKITLNLNQEDFRLFLFALENAPIMETSTPANQLKPLVGKLNFWANYSKTLVRNQDIADSIALSKAPKKPKQ